MYADRQLIDAHQTNVKETTEGLHALKSEIRGLQEASDAADELHMYQEMCRRREEVPVAALPLGIVVLDNSSFDTTTLSIAHCMIVFTGSSTATQSNGRHQFG